MIKLEINNNKGIYNLSHGLLCRQHIEEEMIKLIDILIYDKEIKSNSKYKNMSIKEKEEIVKNIRNDYLKSMMHMDVEYNY